VLERERLKQVQARRERVLQQVQAAASGGDSATDVSVSELREVGNDAYKNEEYTQAEQIYTMALDAAAAAAAAASSSGTESVAGLDEERATVLSNR
jgi:hypothetical protein